MVKLKLHANVELKTIKNMKTTIKVNNWTVSKISETEIKISNGFVCCYAYISKDLQKLYFDVIYCPKTVQKRALQFARKHIKTIY